MDRKHHEARLDRRHRAVSGIDAFDLARDQAVGDVAGAGAAIFLGHGRAQQAGFAHHGEQFGIVDFVAEILDHAWLQLALRESVGGIADHPLFLG